MTEALPLLGGKMFCASFFDDGADEEETTEEVAADNCPIYFTDSSMAPKVIFSAQYY